MNKERLLDASPTEIANALEVLKSPTWKVGGYVLVDTDTANMYIVADGKVRMLVTCERNELMEPTKPCFQLGLEKMKEEWAKFHGKKIKK